MVSRVPSGAWSAGAPCSGIVASASRCCLSRTRSSTSGWKRTRACSGLSSSLVTPSSTSAISPASASPSPCSAREDVVECRSVSLGRSSVGDARLRSASRQLRRRRMPFRSPTMESGLMCRRWSFCAARPGMCPDDCSDCRMRRLSGVIHDVKLKSSAGYANTSALGSGSTSCVSRSLTITFAAIWAPLCIA